MTEYKNANYVAAAPPTDAAPILPALPPAHAVEILPPADVAVEDVLARSSMRAIEKTSPLLQAQSFMLRYASLSVVLLILSSGLTWLAAAPAPVALVLFGGMSIVGYFALGKMENEYTTAGVERLRLREGGRTLRAKIDADRDVALAQVELQQSIVEAQTEYNRQQDARLRERITAQVARHETPQTAHNRQANYVPPAWLQAARQADERRLSVQNSVVSVVSPEVDTGYTGATMPATPATFDVAQPAHLYYREELTPPSWLQERTIYAVRDDARRKLTEFVASLYERDESGSWLRLHEDGRVRRNVRSPMSARSGLSAQVREQIDSLLRELDRSGAWLLRYDEAQRLYILNVARYPDGDAAIDGIDGAATPRLM